MTSLGANASYVFQKLYFDDGEHTPDDVFTRVVNAIVKARPDLEPMKEDMIAVQREHKLRVNTPAMMNLGCNRRQIASACFVGDLQDSMKSIKRFYDDATEVFLAGAGIGANFSDLREREAYLSTGGTSSGPLAFIRHLNSLGGTIKSGGKTRRAAAMVVFDVSHPDILDAISLKLHEDLSNINISINLTEDFIKAVQEDGSWELRGVTDKQVKTKIKARQIMQLIADASWACGDPGVLFLDRVNQTNTVPSLGPIRSSNPCLTGETLIAAADGRGCIPIKQLAEEGRDVPVYCNDSDGKLQIRVMRNPRLTSEKQPILRVNLDSGDYLRVTPNHKFVLSCGGAKEAKDLIEGDSLTTLTKRVAKLNEIHPNLHNAVQPYIWVRTTAEKRFRAEHRLIFQSCNGKLKPGLIVHHKDFNSLNNAPSNLEGMTKPAHDALHSLRMQGDNNPMRRFPEKNPFKNPESQERWRLLNHIGAKRSNETKQKIGEATHKRFKDPAYKLQHGKAVGEGHKRTGGLNGSIKFHERALCRLDECQSKTDLKCFLVGNSVIVRKNCEACGIEFNVSWTRREQSFCTHNCFLQFHNKRQQQRWQKRSANHRVVSIVEDGFEDVYNGTVDEFHNFFIGGFKETNDQQVFVSTQNCGEQFLVKYGSCNLASVNIGAHVKNGDVNWEDLMKTTRLAVRILDGMLDAADYPTPRFKEVALKTRNIGVGIMGLADTLIKLNLPYDTPGARDLTGSIMRAITFTAWTESSDIASEVGPFELWEDSKERLKELWGVLKPTRNAQVTTIAPTGTVSISCECSSGMEPLFAVVYEKKISDTGDIMNFIHPEFERRYSGEKWYTASIINEIKRHFGSIQKVEGIPDKVKRLWRTAHDIHWMDRVLMQAELQKWVTNSISSTINLPHTADTSTIQEIYRTAYDQGLKGVTIYRDGSKTNQPITFGGAAPEARRIQRPKRLFGFTERVKTGQGNMYITINENAGVPFECFVEIGKSGGNKKADAEALGRMASLNLQLGGTPQMVYEQLVGIAGKDIVWSEGRQVLSIYDALAKVLWEQYLNPDRDAPSVFYDECPVCHGRFIHEEGCPKCLDCGFSKCV